MATLQCCATFTKVKLQCFTAFKVWRNDLYRATAKTHTKNYNLRTSQKTITNFCFCVLQHKRNSLHGEARVLTPAESFTEVMILPPKLCANIKDPTFTAAGNVSRTSVMKPETATQTERLKKNIKPHLRRQPS